MYLCICEHFNAYYIYTFPSPLPSPSLPSPTMCVCVYNISRRLHLFFSHDANLRISLYTNTINRDRVENAYILLFVVQNVCANRIVWKGYSYIYNKRGKRETHVAALPKTHFPFLNFGFLQTGWNNDLVAETNARTKYNILVKKKLYVFSVCDSL